MPGPDVDRRVAVLEAFRPTETTNPYLLQLTRALDGLVDVHTFTWPRLLAGRYDVVHLHWPEVHVERRGAVKTAVRRLAFVAGLTVARVRRRAIVRTLHNTRPHEPPDAVQRAILRLCDRWTSEWIVLTPSTRPPRPGPVTTIPHGHYRDWYPDTGTEPVPGRAVFFGLLRRYKGVEDLLAAAHQVERSPFSLRIVGRCVEPDLADAVEAAARADRRIVPTLEFVTEPVLAREIQAAELVILPFRVMENSGSVLLALSLSRPVLVPRSPSMQDLADEIGGDWVVVYDGVLGATTITDAMGRARHRPAVGPDLSRRDWGPIAAAHVEVFRRAGGRTASGV